MKKISQNFIVHVCLIVVLVCNSCGKEEPVLDAEDNGKIENEEVTPTQDPIPCAELEFVASFSSEALAESTSFTIGDFGYICGGYTSYKRDYSNDLWRYDYREDSWQQMADFPGGQSALMSSFVIDGLAYVGAGSLGDLDDGSVDFHRYDPSIDQWNRIADLPELGRSGNGFSIGEYGYVTGLYNPSVADVQALKNSTFRYDPQIDSWEKMSINSISALTARNMAVALNDKAYFIDPGSLTKIFEYDPIVDNWNLKTTFYMNCNDGIALPYQDKIVIASGRGADSLMFYDPALNEINSICIDEEGMRSEGVGFNFGDEIYVGLGIEHDLESTTSGPTLNSTYKIKLD